MSKNLKKTVYAGLFTAIIFIATFFIKIPVYTGYVNFGDCFVILSAIFLGPLYGGFASGIGSALADVFSGYTIYAPATFIIKALMAVIAYFTYKKFKKTGAFLCAVFAEIIMVTGYFLFETAIYGLGVGTLDILWNAVQGAVGAIASVILIKMNIFKFINKND